MWNEYRGDVLFQTLPSPEELTGYVPPAGGGGGYGGPITSTNTGAAGGEDDVISLLTRQGFRPDANGVYTNPARQESYDPRTGIYTLGNGNSTGDPAIVTNLVRNLSQTRETDVNTWNTSRSASTTDRNIAEYGSRISNQQSVTNQTTSRNAVTNRTGTQNISGSRAVYIDVPTPEEFLDEFQNGLALHVKNLRAQGLGLNQALWMMENADMFLTEYLGEMATRASRGEQVFRPMDVVDDARLMGSRQGEFGTERTQGTTTTQSSGSESAVGSRATAGDTSEWVNRQTDSLTNQNEFTNQYSETADRLRSQETGQATYSTGKVVPSSEQTTQDELAYRNANTTSQSQEQQRLNDRIFSQMNTSGREDFQTNTQFNDTEVMNQDMTTNTNVRDDVYARSKIGYVKTLAPADFLGSKFTPGAINMMYEGRRGVRQANFRVGGNVAAKRIG